MQPSLGFYPVLSAALRCASSFRRTPEDGIRSRRPFSRRMEEDTKGREGKGSKPWAHRAYPIQEQEFQSMARVRRWSPLPCRPGEGANGQAHGRQFGVILAENTCKPTYPEFHTCPTESRMRLITIPLWPSVANSFISRTCKNSKNSQVRSIPLDDKATVIISIVHPHLSQNVREQADVALLNNSHSLPSPSRDNPQ